MLVISPPKLLEEWEEDETVLPHHSTPVRRGRMVMWPYRYCRPLPPSEPKELSHPSYVLLLRDTTPPEKPAGVCDP